MLDDAEWKRVSSLFNTGTEGDSRQRMFAVALREHERITGFHETNPNVRMTIASLSGGHRVKSAASR